jgi:LacI family transcriptional regulator
MRGNTVVADSTRDRVLAAAEELGYVYNRAASNLRTAQTGSVGVLITTVANPFFSEFIGGLEQELTSTDQVVFFGQHYEDLEIQERLLRRFLENRVDGIVLVAAEGTMPQTVERLGAMGTAVVLATRRSTAANASYIGSDSLGGVAAATRHLLTGHSPGSLAFVGSGPGGSSHRERLAGMFVAIDEVGFPHDRVQVVTTGVTTRDAAYEVTRNLMATKPGLPLAIVAYNDVVGFGVAAAVRDADLCVGRDVMVVGFDGIDAARYEPTPLTTVSTGPHDMGRLAGRTLREMLQGNAPPTDTVQENQLTIRESCGCPK